MPKPLPAKNQLNSKRLWIGYWTYNRWGKGWRIPERYQDQYGWQLPNTRRWRKLIRKVLGEAEKSRIIYDLINDPGEQTVGYAYRYYAMTRTEPSVGSLAKAELDKQRAIEGMRALLESTDIVIRNSERDFFS